MPPNPVPPDPVPDPAERIFHDLLDVPRDQREATLQRRCAGDTTLMAELRSLLEACEAEELFGSRIVREARSAAAHPGRLIGPYCLDSLIGRGGMGAVYLAHRDDGQFEQQVAIKLIDMPLATDLFRERFRLERQILAGLVHPYIAHMLDGGVAETGELYLAMDFVDGVSIQRFCEENSLSLRDRLALFLKVCGAVQFAHQNLVIHRDLKPDNILVAADGTPRLLDFGTAKLVVPTDSDAASGFTQLGLQAFTPQYASPEQVLGDPITTASDIYSLGVLLYLLLARVLPYELKEFTTAEMLRVICTDVPPKPSSVATMSHFTIDADLDAIILKALRKEPQQRYLTVDQFAADIQAWIDGRPVSACRGNWSYIAGKFVRRNKVPLAAAALLLVSIMAGIAGVLWQAHVANRERQRAEARSQDLRQLSNSLLSELDQALKDIPGSTGAQKLLVSRVLEHLDRMAADAQGDRQTQLDLARAYTSLGGVQGDAYEQNAADTPGALKSLGKAIALAQAVVDAHPSDTEALRVLATAVEDRGEVLTTAGNPENSIAALKSAVQTYDRILALPGVTAPLLLEASTANQVLGDEYCEDAGMADNAAGIAMYRRSLAMDERALSLDPTYMPARRGPGYMHLHIGNAQIDEDSPRAREEFRIALKVVEALPAQELAKLNTLRLHAVLVRKIAVALADVGDYTTAAPLFAQSLAIYRKLAEADPKDTRAFGDLKRVLDDAATASEAAADPVLAAKPGQRQQNLQTAAAFLQEEAATIRKLIALQPGNDDPAQEVANVQVRLGAIQYALGQPAETEAVSRAAIAVLQRIAMKSNASPRNLDLSVSAMLRAEPASLRNRQQIIAMAERGVALTHRKRAYFLLELAQALQADGQPKQADAIAREGIALLDPPRPGDPPTRIRKLLLAVLITH